MMKKIKFSLCPRKQGINFSTDRSFGVLQNEIEVITQWVTKLLLAEKSKSTLGTKVIYHQYIYL